MQKHFSKANLYLLNVYDWAEWQFLMYLQHTLTFNNKTYKTHPPYTSYEFLVTTCLLYRNQLKPIPCCPYWHPKYFQVQSPPFPLAVLTKMLVAENLGVSAFRVLQSGKQNIVYKQRLCWTGLLNWHQETRNCTKWFRQERVPFASWERCRGQRSWRRFVSWTVTFWYSLFHRLWM